MTKLIRSAAFATLALGMATANLANATVISMDAWRTGDGRLTADTSTGLSWLDLKLTRDLSYNDIFVDDVTGLIDLGFRGATIDEVTTLLHNAGASAGPIHSGGYSAATNGAAETFISLFGCTRCIAVYSQGLIVSPSNSAWFGGAETLPSGIGGFFMSGIDQFGFFEESGANHHQFDSGWFLVMDTSSITGLLRGQPPRPATFVPEPSTLTLLGIGLASLMLRRRVFPSISRMRSAYCRSPEPNRLFDLAPSSTNRKRGVVMPRLHVAAAMLALLGALWPTLGSAVPLAEVSFHVTGAWRETFEIRSTFYVGDEFGNDDWIIEPLGPTHSRTFQATRATASHFALLEWDGITARLTNGRDDNLGWNLGFAFIGGGGGTSGDESYFFNLNGTNSEGDITAFTFVPLLNGIDFAGYNIRRISMHLSDLSFSDYPSTEFPVAFGGTAKFTIHGSLAKTNPVPEPNSTVLLALALVGLLSLRVRRYRR